MSTPGAPSGSATGFLAKLHWAEDATTLVFLGLMAILPLVEIFTRIVGLNVPGSIQYVEILTMWVGFTGALLATRDNRHLALATGSFVPKGWPEHVTKALTVFVAATATAVLAWGAYLTVEAEAAFTTTVPPGIPGWIFLVMMPAAYAFIAIRLVLVGLPAWKARLPMIVVIAAALAGVYFADADAMSALLWPAMIVVLLATVFGSPVYVAMGAAALLLFAAADEPIAAVASATVQQIRDPIIPTIPLFTFTGYLLAEAQAPKRLVRVFRALFGWAPGGIAVMTALVCAFFTTFTGASGVTILALGGLLFPMLQKERYPEGFSIGLLTASGSIGLLFPPSLPVILYGVVAHVPIDRMFVAGLVPGVVLVGAVTVLGIRSGIRAGVKRTPFELREAWDSVRAAKWELALPFLVLGGIFLGFTTLVEAAALTTVYTLIVEVFVYRDLSIKKDLVRVARDCATLVGGVLIILGVARGLASYMVDAGIPEQLLNWVRTGIESKFVFLIALNVFLLVVGCLMDIFSALVVVVPLILPLGKHFGIDPIHLGIIFLANLELGFLTPPVGMNLFLASYRFEKPLTQVYRYAVPFLLVLIAAVLAISYLPELSLAPVRWVFGETPELAPIEF